jgi:hypothetical protein
MTQQDESPGPAKDEAQEIQRQFAQLQAEMKRVMAEPHAAAPEAAQPTPTFPTEDALDFTRIEQGLDALRRDADRLRARMTNRADDIALADAVAALQARTEEIARQSADIGRRAEESNTRLTQAVHGNRETIEDMAFQLEALTRRRWSRWLVPLAILLGALAIGAAVLLSVPGRTEMLIDRVNTLVFQQKPHAELAPAPLPPPEAPPPAPAKAAEAAPIAPVPAPAPVPASVPPVAEAPSLPAAPAPVAAASAPPPPTSAEPPVAGSPPPATASASIDAGASHRRIVLRAKGDTWIEVRNRQGGVLVGRVLRDGETWPVPEQASLVLSTGNAGGLELLVDGNPAPSLGGVGMVRRDVPLDPDLVRAGRYTPDLPVGHPKSPS